MPYIVGDRVIWLHQERGGHCHLTPIAGIVEKVGKKVKIKVALPVPEGWTKATRTVDPAKLRLRHAACAGLGETEQ